MVLGFASFSAIVAFRNLEPKFLFSVYALRCILLSIRSLMLQANHILYHCII